MPWKMVAVPLPLDIPVIVLHAFPTCTEWGLSNYLIAIGDDAWIFKVELLT